MPLSLSPIGAYRSEAVAKVIAEGYSVDTMSAYHGHYRRCARARTRPDSAGATMCPCSNTKAAAMRMTLTEKEHSIGELCHRLSSA
jgi:hypothetical protein